MCEQFVPPELLILMTGPIHAYVFFISVKIRSTLSDFCQTVSTLFYDNRQSDRGTLNTREADLGEVQIKL